MLSLLFFSYNITKIYDKYNSLKREYKYITSAKNYNHKLLDLSNIDNYVLEYLEKYRDQDNYNIFTIFGYYDTFKNKLLDKNNKIIIFNQNYTSIIQDYEHELAFLEKIIICLFFTSIISSYLEYKKLIF